MDATASIHSWVKDVLSKPELALGGLPPCPYAAESLLKNQVSVHTVSAKDFFRKTWHELDHFLSEKNFKVQILACQQVNELPLPDVENFVNEARKFFASRNIWLLYDHPACLERVSDFKMNNGLFVIFFIQKLSDLIDASNALKKTNYYSQWSEEYYNTVVVSREIAYMDYLKKINTNKPEAKLSECAPKI